MMRKNYIKALFIGCIITIVSQTIQSTPTGAPEGRTGSPADGSTCTSCHGGTANPQDNIITSNIPTEGYTPGQTYTITVTLAGASERKGFQVSPQKSDGTVLGTLAAGSNSRVQSNKWITHSSALRSSPAVWTFNWTAPVAGSGAVTFYGAFAVSQANTLTDQLLVAEKATTGITENGVVSKFSLYPNPVVNSTINISYTLKTNANVTTNLVDLTGKTVVVLDNRYILSGKQEFNYQIPDINNGVYFLQLISGDKCLTRRIMINK